MARIAPLALSEIPELKPIFDAGQQLMGFLPNDGLTMAYQPNVLKAFLGLVQSIYAPSEISGGLKRLLGLICSSATGCKYCQAHAANGAFKQAEDVEKIKAVWNFRESDLFSLAEKAALEIAYKSALIPNGVTDEDFSELKSHYSNKQIVEIVAVISMYAFLNRWNATLQTDLEETPAQFFENIKHESRG